MSGDALSRRLERLRAATEEIAPDASFSDAVMRAAAEEHEDPLASIARRTQGIEPSPSFTDAVVRSLPAARAPSWTDGVGRAGPVAVALAFVAAAASFALFVSSQRDVDQTIVSSVDSVEVIE